MSTTIAHDPFASLAQYPLDTPPPGQEVETEMDRLVSAGWSHSSGDGYDTITGLPDIFNVPHSYEVYASRPKGAQDAPRCFLVLLFHVWTMLPLPARSW